VLTAVSVPLMTACASAAPGSRIQMTFKFSQGAQDWTAGVSDYSLSMQSTISFVADYRPLQAPLDTRSSALFLASANRSDDLFMYYKRRVFGLSPNGGYAATLTVTIATNTPHGCGGVGGAPGESVFFKAGASSTEPLSVLDDSGNYRMNIDKGNQSTSGANAIVIGDIADDLPCETANMYVWQPKTLSSGVRPVPVRANADGSVWLIVGTDSGSEGVTSL